MTAKKARKRRQTGHAQSQVADVVWGAAATEAFRRSRGGDDDEPNDEVMEGWAKVIASILKDIAAADANAVADAKAILDELGGGKPDYAAIRKLIIKLAKRLRKIVRVKVKRLIPPKIVVTIGKETYTIETSFTGVTTVTMPDGSRVELR